MNVISFSLIMLLGVMVTSVVQADQCDDSYMLSTSAASPDPNLSVAAINGILKAHNDARRNVTPSARVMPMLKWNQKLADYAHEYMNTCVGMSHSAQSARSNSTRFGFNYIGENLAAGSGSNYLPTNGGGASSTNAWNSELQYWTYPTACSGVCGHYTQNIWATTTDVGCGYARCDSLTYKNYWSCVYGPGGNYADQAPYQQSTSTELATCQTGNTPAPVTSGAATTQQAGSTAAPTQGANGTQGAGGTQSANATQNANATQSANATQGSGASQGPNATTLGPNATQGNATQGNTSSTGSQAPASSSPAPSATQATGSQAATSKRYRQLKISGTYWSQVINTKHSELVLAMKRDVALALGVSSSIITIVKFSIGSLIVDYTLDGASTSSLADTTIDSTLLSSGYSNSQALYTTETSSAETISPQESKAVSPPEDETMFSSCKRGCAAMIVIGFFVVLALIVGVWCACKKKPKEEENESGKDETNGHQQYPPTQDGYNQQQQPYYNDGHYAQNNDPYHDPYKV